MMQPVIHRLLLATVIALWAGISSAQETPQAGIQNTITAQLDAFRADDFNTAFTFASPSIQGIFGTPERFGQMVQQGYPMVARPGDVRYLELREIAGALWQKVEITDAEGNLHYLDYRMILQDGAWKISGVQILRPPEVIA